MKKNELSKYTDKYQIEDKIDELFLSWDDIYINGKEGTWVTDGFILNCIRNDICQLRDRLINNFPQEVVGQVTFFGSIVESKRALPPLVKASYMAKPKSKAYIYARFAKNSMNNINN